MSRKSDDYSRHLFQTFVLLPMVPLQAASMWVHPVNSFLDWTVLGLLGLIVWAHFDGPSPDPD